MKNIIYLILIILVSLPISCDDPNEGNNYAVRDGDPVGTWLEKNENFPSGSVYCEKQTCSVF